MTTTQNGRSKWCGSYGETSLEQSEICPQSGRLRRSWTLTFLPCIRGQSQSLACGATTLLATWHPMVATYKRLPSDYCDRRATDRRRAVAVMDECHLAEPMRVIAHRATIIEEQRSFMPMLTTSFDGPAIRPGALMHHRMGSRAKKRRMVVQTIFPIAAAA